MTFATPLLRLTERQYATIVAHCYDGYPDEACGLLTGRMRNGEPDGHVTDASPCENAERSARTYTIAPRDMLRVIREAEARGDDIVGVWHSHTHTDAYPSPTDVRLAVDPAWICAIVSLRDSAPVLRAYRVRDGVIAEVAITIEA